MQWRDREGREPAAIEEVVGLTGKRVLEVGCGTGRLTRFLASQAASVYAFTLSWNEYLYAFTLLSDSEKFTLAPGLTKLIFGDVFLWGMIMAGGFLMSIPILLLYFVAQRYIVAGLAAGAVKG